MRIVLLSPLPPEQTGIADYAAHFSTALEAEGVEVLTPLRGCSRADEIEPRLATVEWSQVDLVHAELGGGRLLEFQALSLLRQRFPALPLTATVHDPERLVWRRARLPRPLSWLATWPRPFPQVATVLADPLTLYEERQLAKRMTCLITLTAMGGRALQRRMRLNPEQLAVIPHGNLVITPCPLPPLEPLRLLYFGFIYRGKGIEDLLEALALVLKRRPHLRGCVRLTLAGGTEPDMAFGPVGNYLEELRERGRQLDLQDLLDWQLDLPAEQIAETIQAHHAMLLPYRESKKLALLGEMRGTSGALSWANACGRGVITSNARAFAEEVAGGNGATYPQGDVQALSECIERLALQPQLTQQWADHAATIAQTRAWPATARRFRQLFSSFSARGGQ